VRTVPVALFSQSIEHSDYTSLSGLCVAGPSDPGHRALYLPARNIVVSSVLTTADRQKIDVTDDSEFYGSPRFVTHADDAFLSELTALYGSVADPGDRVFDAMSSWVSSLPDQAFERVVGHGLNEEELAANEQLDEWFLQDLNGDQSLPLETDGFDLVCCALSVQYLQYPGPVFAEFERVLDSGGAVVVSFTNRMFPTKAVRAWRSRTMDERATLVESYLAAGGLAETTVVTGRPGTDPFYAVVGRRA
jgi:Methyltransferase domain.